MADPVYLLFAAMGLLATALCLVHAYPDRERLSLLGTVVVYGVLLEQLVILRFEAYQYPVQEFLLTVADVPIVIGLGWATIVYAGLHTGRALGVSDRRLPLFVGLYALHIDLSMDAVAIRVPFWTWTPAGEWFGVPLGNFTGWFLVATLFTGAWLGLRPRLSRPELRGPVALVLAVIGLIVLLEAWTTVATTLPRKVAILGAALAASVALVARDGTDPRPVARTVAAVPFLYHGFFVGLLLWFGMYRQQPFLLVVSLAMIGVGVALHGSGLLGRVDRRLPA